MVRTSARLLLTRLVISWSGWLAVLAWTGSVLGQEASSAAVAGSAAERVSKLIDQLDAPTYAARQLAYSELKSIGADAIPVIEARAVRATPECATAMIRFLSEMRPEGSSVASVRSLDALRKVAESPQSFAGDLAKRTLNAIASKLRVECERRLRDLSVFIDVGNVQVLSYPTELYHLEIDDQFSGKASDLDSLIYLSEVEHAVLSGNKITAEIIAKVARLPNLKYLQLKKVRLDDKAWPALNLFPAIDTLEIVYCPVTDAQVNELAAIGGLYQLSLFGTSITYAGCQTLREKAKQVEIVFHGGGFLGIRSRDQNGITIDDVVPGGPAERAGIMMGDRIIRMNDKPLAKFEDLREELSKFTMGDSVTVVFERPQGSQLIKREVLVHLGERP